MRSYERLSRRQRVQEMLVGKRAWTGRLLPDGSLDPNPCPEGDINRRYVRFSPNDPGVHIAWNIGERAVSSLRADVPVIVKRNREGDYYIDGVHMSNADSKYGQAASTMTANEPIPELTAVAWQARNLSPARCFVWAQGTLTINAASFWYRDDAGAWVGWTPTDDNALTLVPPPPVLDDPQVVFTVITLNPVAGAPVLSAYTSTPISALNDVGNAQIAEALALVPTSHYILGGAVVTSDTTTLLEADFVHDPRGFIQRKGKNDITDEDIADAVYLYLTADAPLTLTQDPLTHQMLLDVVLGVGDIPPLPASQITSGVFNVARIPALSTDILTAGILPLVRGGTGSNLTASGPGTVIQSNVGAALSVRKDNFNANTPPSVNDDGQAGYVVGSIWIDRTHNNVWQAFSVASGAAIWKRLDNAEGEGIESVIGGVDIAVDDTDPANPVIAFDPASRAARLFLASPVSAPGKPSYRMIADADIYPLIKGMLIAGTNLTITPNDSTRTLTIDATGGGGGTGIAQVIRTVEGALTTGILAFVFPNHYGIDRVIKGVYLYVSDAPNGASILVDIHKNGTTIFSNQANRPAIDEGMFMGDSTTIDVDDFLQGDVLEFHIDQVGSVVSGANLTICLVVE